MLGAVLRAAGGVALAALLFTFGQAAFSPLISLMTDTLGSDSQLVTYTNAFIEFLPLVALLGTATDFIARGVVEAKLPG